MLAKAVPWNCFKCPVVDSMHLGTVVLTDADGTLAADAVGPEAVELSIALAHVGVDNEEPGTEDSLGKNIKNSVGDDLSVNADLAGTVGNTPDTV
jgi:hypothetical protein